MSLERIPYDQYLDGFWTIYYSGSPVRIFYISNVFWFVLTDICILIGLGNASKAAARLDADEQMTLPLRNSHSGRRGGAQKLLLINEPGLYHLLLTSDKPVAKSFRHWIMFEVIPSIHRNDGYIMGQDFMDAAELNDVSQQVTQNILAERDLRIQNRAQAMLLREQEPKARYYDAMLLAPKLLTTTAIATEYGITAQRLNKYLQDNGIQYKRNGIWVLCKPYADKGYTYPQTSLCDCNRYPHWTQKGRAFLHDFLRNDGILPLYERPYVPLDTDDPL